MKLPQCIHLSTTQCLIIYRPEWLTSLPVSPLFLGLPSLSVIWLESELQFFRWLTLCKVPCRKKDACQTTEIGSAHGMSCYKWPLTDLLIWPQRVKAAFWRLGVLASPCKCAGKGRRTHPELRPLPAGAGWRLSLAVPGEDRGQRAHLAPRRLLLHIQVTNFPSGQGGFWGRALGGSRR